MHRLRVVLSLGLAALAHPADALDPELVDAAKKTLAGIQTSSITRNREYCGSIGRNGAGDIVITRPNAGRQHSCRPRSFSVLRTDIEDIAVYHTHGGFDPEVDSEIPSLEDLRADQAEGVIGFVATPGGRLWVTDPDNDRVRLLCGRGCLPSDKRYDPAATGKIRKIYTARQLLRRQQGLDD